MDCHVFVPGRDGRWPAVIFYFDAFGIRPDSAAMGRRLAQLGCAVVMPNLFYRTGPFPPFAPTAFQDPAERERLGALIATIDTAKVMRDTERVLELIAEHPNVSPGKIGTVGYCLGGQFSLSAAGAFPERVGAAASIHGLKLAVDTSDSPHRLFPKVRASIYVAVPETDADFPPAECERLKAALSAAGLEHQVEIYPGTRHGFAVNGRLVYDAAAAERHWQRLADLFGRALRAPQGRR